MIVTERRPLKAIESCLDEDDCICLVSCNACARKCNTGGMDAMSQLAEVLREDGYRIVAENLVGTGCGERQLNRLVFDGNVAIVLGCDASVSAMMRTYPNMKIVPALHTVGLGMWDAEENVTVVKPFS